MVKKAPTKKAPVSRMKPAKKVVRSKRAASDTVDFYPNRMTVAVSALAGTLLVLLALIAVLGSKG